MNTNQHVIPARDIDGTKPWIGRKLLIGDGLGVASLACPLSWEGYSTNWAKYPALDSCRHITRSCCGQVACVAFNPGLLEMQTFGWRSLGSFVLGKFIG
jgi:hypothetical protein